VAIATNVLADEDRKAVARARLVLLPLPERRSEAPAAPRTPTAAMAPDAFLGVVPWPVPPASPGERVCTSCHLIKARHLVRAGVCVDCI
jgi:hypothetical protein